MLLVQLNPSFNVYLYYFHIRFQTEEPRMIISSHLAGDRASQILSSFKCQPFLTWLLFFDEIHNVINNSFSSDTGKSIRQYLHNNSTVVTNFHRYLHILCRFQRNHQGKHICHRRISRTRGSCYKLEGAFSLDLKQKHQSHYVYC